MTSTALINNRPQIQDTEQLQQMANALAKSSMCPSQYKGKPQDAFVAIIAGGEVGFQPMQSLKSIAVINGRPTIYGDGLPAIAYGSGQLERFEEVFEGKDDNLTAIVRLERKGVKGVREFRFSVADAKRANLWGKRGPWSDYPTRMLQMRARSYAFRDVFADYLAGLHVAEEVRDYSAAPEQQEARISFETDDSDAPADEVPYPEEDVIDAESEPAPHWTDAWVVAIEDAQTVDELDYCETDAAEQLDPDRLAELKPFFDARRKALLGKEGELF